MILADKEYLLIATGERFRNTDERTRQDGLARCRVGEHIELRREPQNLRDQMAVALFSIRDSQLGYLNREHAAWTGALIDDGEQVEATVHRIAPTGRPGSPLTLTLLVTIGARAKAVVGLQIRVRGRLNGPIWSGECRVLSIPGAMASQLIIDGSHRQLAPEAPRIRPLRCKDRAKASAAKLVAGRRRHRTS